MKKAWSIGMIVATAWSMQAQSVPSASVVTPQPFTINLSKAGEGRVDFMPELTAVTAQIKVKFDAGATNAADLKDCLKAVDDLMEKHGQDGKPEEVARLYLLKAHVFADGYKNTAEARTIWNQVIKDYPGTLAAKGAAISLVRLNAATYAPDPSIPEGLDVGQRFPAFTETSLSGSYLSPAAYRGRVTLIDFWATWCGPCRQELPNVISLYNQFHAQGFDIIGVTLDDNRDAVVNFTRASGMGWEQFFDGQGWDNALAKQFNVKSIPMTYLLDRRGVILGKELRGTELDLAVANALAKK